MRNGTPDCMLGVDVAIGLTREGNRHVKEVLGMAGGRGG